MIEVSILKDIRAYETKLIGPLSLRSTILAGVAGLGAYIAYFVQNNLLGITPMSIFIAIGALPGAMFLVLKPCGLPLEKYIKSAFVDAVLAPKYRPYKQEFTYDKINKAINWDEISDNLEEDDALLYKEDEEEMKKDKKKKAKPVKIQKSKKYKMLK